MIQDAYYFLCLNLGIESESQDEIHLIGFSRGAFAVRALACFIQQVGVLSRTRLALLPMIYALWRKQDFVQLALYTPKWEAKGHLKTNIDIISCGVWDTVSAMIPASDLSFVNTAVPCNLKNAFHAISLHETRTAFPPILWNIDGHECDRTNVKQCWFAGDHSDIGGGHPDAGLATISLLWMIAQYKEYTNIGIAEIMLLDCMTPLFLHWQEKALLNWEEMTFFNKAEYLMQSHVFTKGSVHGPESFATPLWRLPGQSSITARESIFKSRSFDGNVPSKPQDLAQPPPYDLDPSVLNDDAVHAEQILSEKDYATDIPPLVQETSDASPSTQQSSWSSIHFTVRILMSARRQECHLLSKYSTIYSNNRIAWADVTGTRGFYEECPTAWETWMFRQWIKREEDLFGQSPADNERFTRFLYPFRREGERPRKAFYAPAPRTSSTDRSQKIQDADDRVAEAAEKGPDLSQSRSSAATSVDSGVKYCLDLDYEGYLPERFGRLGSKALARRELQVGALYVSKQSALQSKSS
ncbi:hypothetical protein N0V90_008756 [Kalmusia sp. IMI 367209]|nr:hypothetical protein N0V90_008756 [Kalmusia sp. IMI 367209]